MPPVIIAAAAAYAGAITIASFLVITASYAVGQYQASRARAKARDAYNASLKDRLVSTSTVDGFRSRVYGRVRNVDGILFKATRGDKSQYYTLVVALAGHECDAIETVYFNDTPLTLDSNGYVTNQPWNKNGRDAYTRTVVLDGSGNGSFNPTSSSFWEAARNLVPASVYAYATVNGSTVTVATSQSGGTIYLTGGAGLAGATATLVFQGDASQSKARVRKYLGAPGQDLSTVLAPLFPGLITAGRHRFEGICCLIVDLEYDQDAFPSGVPQISAIIRGAKVLDRRTGVTAWSNNPAVIADDWARYAQGGGALESELVTASFIAAANACDVAHTFTSTNADGSTTSTPRPMYTCSIVCRTDANPSDTLSAIVESMAGAWAWTGGQLRVRAGAYSAPVATLTESWCGGQGDIEIVANAARSELVNVYVPTIANADQAYIAAAAPRVAASAYISLDGGELPREVTLEGVTDTDHAQHICGVMLREQRQALTGTIPCNLSAYPIEVFDTIALDLPRFGFTGKTVQVIGWQFSQTGGVVLQWKETDASIYDPDAGFSRSDAAPNTKLPDPFTVPAVTLGTPVSGTAQLLRQADGTVVSRILVSWAAIQDAGVLQGGSIEVRYGPVGSNPAQWATVSVPGSDTQVYLDSVQDGATYLIMARARNKLVAGQWTALVQHRVVGKTAAPAAVVGLSAAVIPGAVRISRTPSTEPDYDYTVYRYGASFASGTQVPGTSDASGIVWPWPALGSYTIWAADVDTSGNVGAPVSAPVTVDSALLIGASGINPPAAWLNSELVPSINAAKGTNLFTGSVGAPFGSSGGGSISAVGQTDPWGTSNAVNVTLPIAGSFVYYRLTGLQAGYYTIKLRLFVGSGASIVVATTDGISWSGSNYTRATQAGGAIWVQVTLRQYTSSGTVDVAVGSQYDAATGLTAIQTSTPVPVTVSISDLWVEREGYTGALDATKNTLSRSASAPSSPTDGDFWIDTSVTPNTIRVRLGGSWQLAGTYVNGTAQIVDDANLGLTALWAGITGTGKPADNATRNYTYQQSGDPAVSPGGVVDGEVWLNTSTNKTYQRYGGVWRPYVGTGSVDTGELAANAATTLAEAFFTSVGVTGTSNVSARDSYSASYNLLGTVTFTPKVTGVANLYISATLTAAETYTRSAAGTAQHFVQINVDQDDDGLAEAGDEVAIVTLQQYVAAGFALNWSGPVAGRVQVSTVAGVSRTLRVYGQQLGSAAATYTLSNLRLGVEGINR